jgi:26S proteasome regulatory subunit N3
MLFPGDLTGKELDSVKAIHEEERKLAKEIIDGELDDEEMGDF